MGKRPRKHKIGKRTKDGVRESPISRLERLGFTTYQDYLAGDHWSKFRSQNISSNCWCCESDRDLQLHHKTYVRLGQELPQDVVTLCDQCHVAVHNLVKKGRALLPKAHFLVQENWKKAGYRDILPDDKKEHKKSAPTKFELAMQAFYALSKEERERFVDWVKRMGS